MLKELTPNPLPASNISAAALFRSIEAARPTLIVDEADTFLAKNDERRGILNSGHNRRTASVVRVEKTGKKLTPVPYSTWAPKAIASIGNLSGTLQDRSIAIRLRRKLPSEKVRNFRADRVQALTNLCRMAARWAADNLDTLRNLDACVPDQLHDRQADNWRALFNIADQVGGEWPAKARAAALAIEGAASYVLHYLRSNLLNKLRETEQEFRPVPVLKPIFLRPSGKAAFDPSLPCGWETSRKSMDVPLLPSFRLF